MTVEQKVVGRDVATGESVRVSWREGRVTAVEAVRTEERLPYVGPGLVDIQVNGYGGVDFNGGRIGAAELRSAAVALWAQGCTSFLPTIITDSPDAIASRLENLNAAAAGDPLLRHAVPGFHVEGPFISPQDGPRGAHPAEHVRAPFVDAIRLWHRASGERLRILTLSPEWDEAFEVIPAAANMGIVVSIGHTSAEPERITAAVRAGATCVTHFGNGAQLMLPRHPNFLWQQLAEDGLFCSVIADGFHLPDSVLKVVSRVKGDRMVVISDATQYAGLPPGDYETHIGGRVTLTPQGRLHLTDNERLLAGSAQSIRHGVEHVLRSGLLPLPEVWAAASERPARLAGIPSGVLRTGAPADLVLFDWDGERLTTLKTFVSGVCVFEK